MQQRRHRRRLQHRRNKPAVPAGMRRLVSAGLVLGVIVYAGSVALDFFGVGNAIRRTATTLTIDNQGVVNVSVEGGPLKRADQDLKLYPGDTIVSSPRNYATLTFFDGTSLRLDESTQVSIDESYRGDEESKITTSIQEGTVWLRTPDRVNFSGSVLRTIRSDYLEITLQPNTEAVFAPRSLTVFDADGLGLEVTVAGSNETVVIGEGQQFTIPATADLGVNLYTYRSPLDPQQILLPFIEESRAAYENRPVATQPTGETGGGGGSADIILSLTAPENNTQVDTSTLEVSGRVGSNVDKVRINGYLAPIENGQFSQELALPEEDTISITVEAVDANGVVLAEVLRTVTRDREPPEPPTITGPAATGETYATTQTEIEITGTAPAGAVGIEVNDYRLQLFEPGDTTWSYLANINFDNYEFGENVYNVVAINRGGYRSEPATITVLLNTNTEGVIEEGGDTSGTTPTPTTEEEAALPDNAPLRPGTINIYAPAEGTEHTTSERELLIEGNVPADVQSVWVNGYRLQLFEPGRGFFNYIASTELNTLRRGRNVYRIVARNEDNEIIDRVEYVINFTP